MTTEVPASVMDCSCTDKMKCCPIDNTFKIIGKKFTIHIIRNMAMLNQNRFCNLFLINNDAECSHFNSFKAHL